MEYTRWPITGGYLHPDLGSRLVSSMQQRKLVIFAGAGLSMSAPSSLPSAAAVTKRCSEAYEQRALPDLPEKVKNDLGEFTEFLFANDYQDLFLNQLVDWNQFAGQSNAGHLAIADFLTARITPVAITTNYDRLIERAAELLGEQAFQMCLDGDCANKASIKHAPLIKIHGSMDDRDATLWCRSQLERDTPNEADRRLQARLGSSRKWLNANLVDRDLVFVGFWSDWVHLSRLLLVAIRSVHAPRIVVVDTASAEQLKAKAPTLWGWANQKRFKFCHVQQSGADFLDELRNLYSQNFLKRAAIAAGPSFRIQAGKAQLPHISFEGIGSPDLYSLRRDFCGVPPGQIPREPDPTTAMDSVGRAYLLLRDSGATLDGPTFILTNGKRVRLINGATRLLSDVKARFMPFLPQDSELDYIVCAGAEDDGGAQPNIVRPLDTTSIVRGGTSAKWLTLSEAHAEGVC